MVPKVFHIHGRAVQIRLFGLVFHEFGQIFHEIGKIMAWVTPSFLSIGIHCCNWSIIVLCRCDDGPRLHDSQESTETNWVMRKNREDEVWPRGFAHACEEEMLNVVRKRFGGEEEFIYNMQTKDQLCLWGRIHASEEETMSWDPESWLWNLFIWRDELEPWILDNDIGHHHLKLLSGISTRGGLTCSSKLFCNSIIWIRWNTY